MKLVSIFIILVGVGGMFSSVWNWAADVIFSNGMMTPTMQSCAIITKPETSNANYQNVGDFAVDVNGTRYECHDQANMVNQLPNSFRWQVPGIFMFGLVIGFGVFLYRHASKHEKQP